MRPLSLGPAGAGCYLFPTLAGYLLVDTGCERTAEELLRQLSRRIGLSELQWIFLTHAHADHAGGLEGLLKGTRARVPLRCPSSPRTGPSSAGMRPCPVP